MKYRIVKEFVVKGEISMDEAIAAVEAFQQQYGTERTSKINTHRWTPQPEDWNKDEQGDWYKSDEWQEAQVFADVQLVDKTSTILW